MALVSPGVDISIVDESQYPAATTATIPFILVATAQNKVEAGGTAVASGTLASAANNTYLISSQRELVNTFGNPFFYKTSAGSSLHGYELNEYGLQAAYSALGVSNRAYVQRVDIDMSELTSTTTRPTGSPSDGTYWLDTTESVWGLFEWNKTTATFTNKVPTVITKVADLVGTVSTGAPLTSIGNVGDYVVNATHTNNPMYYKNRSNTWVLLGSDAWMNSHATASGTSGATTTASDEFSINGTTVTLTGTTVAQAVIDITTAAITGITAAEVSGALEIYADTTATNSAAVLTEVTNTPLNDLGITAATYASPALAQAAHTSNPQWRTTDTTPRPNGSVWHKTTSVNLGANLSLKRYSTAIAAFDAVSMPVYENDQTANKEIDPSAGGSQISVGTAYAMFDSSENDTGSVRFFRRNTTGATEVTGTLTSPTLTATDQYTISASAKGVTTMTTAVTVTLSGATAADFVSDFLAANVANTSASVTSTGAVKITHTQGGVIVLKDTTGTPVTDVGILTTISNVRAGNDTDVILSNWESVFDTTGFTADENEPNLNPTTGTKWFFADVDDIDIMMHDGTNWKGYTNVSNDVRGFDLSTTDPAGPQTSPTAPTTQSDDTVLVYGDLWIDSSDLDNYPKVNRWESVSGVDQWVAIDTADQTTEDGIVFADARWGDSGDVDPITDDLTSIVTLLSSDYLALDAPSASLYPTGTLLFNTRRSGYNVKEFKQDYYNSADFTGSIPNEVHEWVTASGLKDDGSPFMGRLAQRAMVIQALKAGIDANTEIREEERRFNLMACPGYPELIPNMVALNNDRNNTAFIIGDTPIRLAQNGTDLINWATNNSGVGLSTGDGLPSNDEYLGVFYPSGKTNDLTGSEIVVPPSHMMIRTIIRSDDSSYPWLAPAGARRGGVDNASALGYVDTTTGEFQQIAVRESIRDTLYENNVNPITFIPGIGLANFGNKTTVSGSSLDRINVSRLISYIRLQAESAAKNYIFEPNDKFTRDELKSALEGIMNDLIAKRGIYDYLVVVDDSNNTPARIDRNEMYADIAIEPVKAAEFIYVPIRIRNTGDIAGGN